MPEGRNFLVQDFLDTDGEWLFMVDSDMVFPHDSAKRLLDSADPQTAPVVGGLCFGLDKTLGQFPTLYRDIGGHPAVLFDFPASGLVEVDGTGAAFILTHRSVFENNIRPGVHKWYHRFEIPGGATGFGVAPGGMLGEDLSWCRWLRSRGVPIYVNVGVEAGHVKPITIGRSTYARNS
jgi:hypothetical protein